MSSKITIRYILFICLLLHICLLLIIHFIFRAQFYIERYHGNYDDGEAYSNHARIISLLLLNKFPKKDININLEYPDLKVAEGQVLSYANQGYVVPVDIYEVGYITYFYALIYTILGYHPFLVNIINILMNLLTGIIIFKICKMVSDEKAGIIAMTIFLFNPVSFYYATTKLAESSYIFIFYVLIYSTLLLLQKKFFYILPLIISLFLLSLFKKNYFIPIIAIFSIYLFLSYVLKRKIRLVICGYAILMVLLLFSDKIYQIILKIMQKAAYFNKVYCDSGGLTYNLLLVFGDNYYNYNFWQWFIYFIKAWYHMLAEPIHPNSILYLLYYPFKVLFLFLCFFSFFGTVISFRSNKKPTTLLLIFFIIIGTVLSLASGNVGTMLRHRDIITPIVFIFSSVFMARYFKLKINNERF